MFIALLGILAITTSAGAQIMFPHIVMGRVKNPDGTYPTDKQVEFYGFLKKAPENVSAVDSCSEGGGWAIDVVLGIPSSTWEVGDTVEVHFKHVGEGEFSGQTYILKYETTDVSPDSVVEEITLPVELSVFTARLQEDLLGENVLLEWQTMSETNNFGFEIHRSQDKKEYEKIGFVAGAGSTNTARTYRFVDEDVAIQKYYYRLKQLDTNGQSAFSDVVEIDVTAPTRYDLSQNFPNPFNPQTDIVFRLKEDVRVKIKVFNILGREVVTIVDNRMKAGTHRITFDGSQLPSGMYLYRMEAGDFKSVKKMILIK